MGGTEPLAGASLGGGLSASVRSPELEFVPLHDVFGAEVRGVDLREPLSGEQQEQIFDGFNRHSVLVFRDQSLEPADQVRFARLFGEPAVFIRAQFLVHGFPELLRISNVFKDGKPTGNYDGTMIEWHSDLSWAEKPAQASFLYGIEIPPVGGDTLFASTCAAFDELPPDLQERLIGLRVIHSFTHLTEQQRLHNPTRPPLTEEQKRAAPDVVHPLAPRHPITGRRSLWIGTLVVKGIEGLPADEGDGLVAELLEHATADRFVYRHVWKAGDLVVWDNRSTLHTITPCDRERFRRTLHRATVKGDPLLA